LKVVASWSGGKDSCFACYKAIKQGLDVSHVLTFMANSRRSNFHALSADVLDAQSDCIGIPLITKKTTWGSYEADFKDALALLKAAGVEGLVTGDIYDVALHEPGWLDRVCREVGVKPVKPLWAGDTLQIMKDFLSEGFEAVVVRTKLDILGEEWLGRKVDKQFLSDLLKLGNVDPCGEKGEYHTVVTDGPLFKKRINIVEGKKSAKDGYGLFDVKRFEVVPKKK
jgi:uncharacterized protein (TIGR00290 family)